MKSLASYLSFTGQAGCYAELPLDVLAGATTFTIEVKISTASTKSTGDAWKWGTIAGREIPFFGKDDFGLCVNDGKLCFWCSPASKGTSNSNTQAVTSSVTVNDGEIHKVAVVSSNGAIDLYCDGVKVAHTDNVNAKITDAQTILLAYDSDSNSYLQMDLYEARFWNVARSAEEIFADITGTETGLQGWYLPTADGLKDYSGNNRHATLYGSPAYENPQEAIFTADVERVIKNSRLRISALKVWLPFDESTTEDKCVNEWTAYGSPTISNANAINGNALQLNGSSQYLFSERELGGQDFTVSCYENKTGGGRDGAVFVLYYDESHFMTLNNSGCWFINYSGTNTMPTGLNHVEFNYVHSEQRIYYFVNGLLVNSRSTDIFAQRRIYKIALGCGLWGGGVNDSANYWAGTIDEFQIYDGVALHTENFTPPTAAEYEELAFQLDSHVEFTVDVERRISNRVEFTADVERTVIAAWRYFNAGTATTLTVTGTTLTDLPETKSVTGTAFYQNAREKCFDLPTTAEIWLKFDVYFDGSARWRAYNGGANGSCGVTAQTDGGEFDFWVNGARATYFANTAKKNQLQTVLLHMVSGSSAGVVEAWVDGTKIHTYTGNVNNGVDFADIYLQSDGAGTFFSNVIISNREIGLTDGYQKLIIDVERKVSNRVEFTADVRRWLVKVINVPSIFGDHFNHCVRYINVYGAPIKFKLPKKSKVYLYADPPIYVTTYHPGIAVRIFSDTDAKGTVTGDVYATFDECEGVFLQSTVSPQSILYEFMWKLHDTSGDKLDAAIEYCTGGFFSTKDELVESFLNDLDNSESNLDFLSRCCGVDLSNEDTGAVIGSDAGGGYPKTAESIVPEPVPVEEWVVPEKGAFIKIGGVNFQFPTSGYKGVFTDAEKHILAGLNSVWIEQALLLIRKSCGMIFNQNSRPNVIYVKFVNESNNALAYVAATYQSDGYWATKLELCVNMHEYSRINTTSEDGALRNSNDLYLDRTLAHELTHAIMVANICGYSYLPLFVKEGTAEFIHGIDDESKSRIQYITQPAQRSTLQEIFSTGGTSGDINIYSAGYLFFRYLIKQTIERGNVHTPSATVTNLFISDGEVDYYGRALTDNTRATLNADTLRELVKTSSLAADVEIFDVIPVEFTADINRAIKAKLRLFAIDSSEYFSGSDNSGTLQPVVIPPQETIPAAPDNTIGLQSIEISLSEQQLTDNVSFVGVVPFDIMFPVQGQYLDYVFDMRVERVQQKGVLYTCDCCVDVDQLLYTQIAYTVPQSTDWHSAGDSSTATATQDDKSVFASYHAGSIARTIGKTPVIQFDDFASTVLTENLGGATYADIIRDVFGWSSRVPTHMINVFIRGDKIYFVQRGHEARLIDLTGTKHTIPIVTHELVRMTWGSTPWSKSETREVNQYETTNLTDDGGVDPDDDPDDTRWTNIGMVVTEDKNGRTVTTYHYTLKGILRKTTAVFESYVDNKENNTKTTINYYDIDGLISGTRTTIRFPHDYQSNSTVSTTYGYVVLIDGKKFLSTEMTSEYDYKGSLINQRTTTKSPTGGGQGTSDDDSGGASGSGNKGDDRTTPYQREQTSSTAQAFKDAANQNFKAEKESRTLNGLSLYDSSFPIHNVNKLMELTEAIRWLNRRTKETVTMTIYEYPHLIDFNDRILFNGAQYFLVSNVAMTNARVFNEQRVTFTRWY